MNDKATRDNFDSFIDQLQGIEELLSENFTKLNSNLKSLNDNLTSIALSLEGILSLLPDKTN